MGTRAKSTISRNITTWLDSHGRPVFQVNVRKAGYPTVTQDFATEADAKRFLRDTERDIKFKLATTGKTAPPSADQWSFEQESVSEILQSFVDSDYASENHKRNFKTIFDSLGDTKVGQLKVRWTRKHIVKMSETNTVRGKPYAWGTLAAHMSIMKVAVRWRADELDLPHPANWFSKTLFPDAQWDNMRDRQFETGEEKKLLDYFRNLDSPHKHHYRLLVRLALETGARLQELLLAEWRHVHLARRLWMIPDENTKMRYERAVPLSKAAMRAFRLLKLLAHKADALVFHPFRIPPESVKPAPKPKPGRRAKPVRHVNANNVSRLFGYFIRKAGLPGFTFHDLRHVAVTRMVLNKRKLSVYEIMKIVGHSSIKMLNRYTNIRGDEMYTRMD